MTAAAVGPNRWLDGYRAATELLDSLPGPMIGMFVPRLLNVTDDPDDDPAYCAGFKQALRDAAAGGR